MYCVTTYKTNQMNTYIIIYISEGAHTDDYAHDAKVKTFRTTDKSDAVRRLLLQASYQPVIYDDCDEELRMFIREFIRDCGRYHENDVESRNKLQIVRNYANDRNLYDTEPSDPINSHFIMDNFNNLHYLLLHQIGQYFRILGIDEIMGNTLDIKEPGEF
jgi:hypothetical protein